MVDDQVERRVRMSLLAILPVRERDPLSEARHPLLGQVLQLAHEPVHAPLRLREQILHRLRSPRRFHVRLVES